MRESGHSFLSIHLLGTDWPFRQLNEMPAEGRYLTILPVFDYHRLQRTSTTPGRLAALTQSDIAELKGNRTRLLLDLSNEGPAFYKPIFDDVHAQLAERGIERNAIVFVSQNRRLGQTYSKNFGPGIQFWSYDHFPKALALWMDANRSPGVFGSQAFEPGGFVPLSDLTGPVYLCQNAAVRWHRVLLYRWLQLSGLHADGLVSFHGVGADNPKGNEINLNAPLPLVATHFPELIAGVSDWIPRKAERFDETAKFGNELAISVDTEAYARTRFSIVPESDFFDHEVERITEKSLKAAAMGHPLIVLGPPRTLSFLRELGFCTFEGAIDQSYDRLEDPVARMRAVFDAIGRAHAEAKNYPEAWRRAVVDEALANFVHARQGGLLKRFDQIVSRPMCTRMEKFVLEGRLD